MMDTFDSFKPRPVREDGGLAMEPESHSVMHGIIQKESMDFDRRQIRRQIMDKLKHRGEEEEIDALVNEDWDDEETIYEDTESFPWKQREAAVQAAALGGKTEGRMEGYDSLERALQAHAHQLVYGRGRGFGWSSQHKTADSPALLIQQHKLETMQNLSESSSSAKPKKKEKKKKVETVTDDPEVLAERDFKAARKRARVYRALNITYVVVAVLVVIVFMYYMETLKASNYEVYVPDSNHLRKAG